MPSDELFLRLATVLSVEDDVELGDVRDKWVVPLHDLVSFFLVEESGSGVDSCAVGRERADCECALRRSARPRR